MYQAECYNKWNAVYTQMRLRVQLENDEAFRNMQDYLSYHGYGNIPWLAAMAAGYLDTETFGVSNDIL